MTDHHPADTRTLTPVPVEDDQDEVLAEAVAVIDGALAQMMQRELVSTGEVADLLLDVRMLLTSKS